MGLLTPFWMKDYSGNSVRQRKKSMERIRQGLSKINAITDEKKLIEIAQKTPVADFRRKAEERIKSQAALKELALRFFDDEALERLEDQDTLKTIALSSDSEHKVAIVVKQIDDEAFFRDIFIEKVQSKSLPCLKDKGMYMSHLVISALLRIHDENYLYKVASLNEFAIPFFEKEQEAAVSNITDQEKLFLLAKNAKHQIAAAAISKIHDREKLNWLAKHCNTKGISPTVGQMAAMKLRGEKFYTPKYR